MPLKNGEVARRFFDKRRGTGSSLRSDGQALTDHGWYSVMEWRGNDIVVFPRYRSNSSSTNYWSAMHSLTSKGFSVVRIDSHDHAESKMGPSILWKRRGKPEFRIPKMGEKAMEALLGMEHRGDYRWAWPLILTMLQKERWQGQWTYLLEGMPARDVVDRIYLYWRGEDWLYKDADACPEIKTCHDMRVHMVRVKASERAAATCAEKLDDLLAEYGNDLTHQAENVLHQLERIMPDGTIMKTPSGNYYFRGWGVYFNNEKKVRRGPSFAGVRLGYWRHVMNIYRNLPPAARTFMDLLETTPQTLTLKAANALFQCDSRSAKSDDIRA